MNKTIIVKAVILFIAFAVNVSMPIGAKDNQSFLVSILFPVLFGALAIPLILKIDSLIFNMEFLKPKWSDNPMSLRRPLAMCHFGAYFFLLTGFSMLIGTAIKFHDLSGFGLSLIGYGTGILIGIELTLAWVKNKTKVPS